jgi:hypothetical protein
VLKVNIKKYFLTSYQYLLSVDDIHGFRKSNLVGNGDMIIWCRITTVVGYRCGIHAWYDYAFKISVANAVTEFEMVCPESTMRWSIA